MIMRHPVALFISTVIGFTIHKTQCLMIELELFCAIAATVPRRRRRNHSGGNSAQ